MTGKELRIEGQNNAVKQTIIQMLSLLLDCTEEEGTAGFVWLEQEIDKFLSTFLLFRLELWSKIKST